MIDELVVALDGSEASLRALRVGGAFARKLYVPISTITVIVPGLDAFPDAAWLDEHATLPDLEVEQLLVPADDTVAALLDRADEGSGTVLCMTSHGRRGLSEAVLGSVSAAVVRASRKPILVVGPNAAVPASFDAVEVCFHDGATPARALGPAGDWVGQLGATPWLVTVQDPAESFAANHAAGVELRAAAERLRDRARLTPSRLLRDADPVRAIAEHADDVGAALVVAATHARHGVDDVLIGSVAKGLVHRVHQPVLLVGPAVVDTAPTGASATSRDFRL